MVLDTLPGKREALLEDEFASAFDLLMSGTVVLTYVGASFSVGRTPRLTYIIAMYAAAHTAMS